MCTSSLMNLGAVYTLWVNKRVKKNIRKPPLVMDLSHRPQHKFTFVKSREKQLTLKHHLLLLLPCLVPESCSPLCDPTDRDPPGSSGGPWDCPGKNPGVGRHFLLQGNLPNAGIKPSSPALAGRFFTTEPLGKL